MEQWIEWNMKVHLNFIDLEKDFDNRSIETAMENPVSKPLPRNVYVYRSVNNKLSDCSTSVLRMR